MLPQQMFPKREIANQVFGLVAKGKSEAAILLLRRDGYDDAEQQVADIKGFLIFIILYERGSK